MPLSAGDKLGRYEIIAPIGKGAMGEVYSAHDPRTGRDVAIKVSAGRFNGPSFSAHHTSKPPTLGNVGF